MKETMIIIGFFISFAIGFYLRDFVEDPMLEDVRVTPSATVDMGPFNPAQLMYPDAGPPEYPNEIPFKQGMTLMPGQSALVEQTFIFKDSVRTKIEEEK